MEVRRQGFCVRVDGVRRRLGRRKPREEHRPRDDQRGEDGGQPRGGGVHAFALRQPLDDEVGDGSGGEFRGDAVGRTPVVRVVGIGRAQSVTHQRCEDREPRDHQDEGGNFLVHPPQDQHQHREHEIGKPLHGQRPCDEIPPAFGVGSPLLNQQKVLDEVDRVPPVTIDVLTQNAGLRENREAGDDEHHQVHGVDPGQAQPPKAQRCAPANR